MYKHISKDTKLRDFFKKTEHIKIIYSFLSYNQVLNSNIDFRAKLIYVKFYQESLRRRSLNRIHNFCFYTGRARGVYRTYHLSRLYIRELASKGSLNGLKKSSW